MRSGGSRFASPKGRLLLLTPVTNRKGAGNLFGNMFDLNDNFLCVAFAATVAVHEKPLAAAAGPVGSSHHLCVVLGLNLPLTASLTGVCCVRAWRCVRYIGEPCGPAWVAQQVSAAARASASSHGKRGSSSSSSSFSSSSSSSSSSPTEFELQEACGLLVARFLGCHPTAADVVL